MNKIAKLAVNLTWIFSLLTATIHSLSFFADPAPANETEKQLVDLMNQYKMDMGAGFHRTMQEIFTSISACLTLLCLLGGLTVWYLSRNKVEPSLMRGVMIIMAFVFGIAFVVMLLFAFLPPIICIGLIFVSSFTAVFALKEHLE